MSELVTYILWPNPPLTTYSNPKVVVLLLLAAALIAGSFAVSRWRKSLTNAVTRKLTRAYAPAMFWFGIIALFLTVCRVEGISYLSMRLWWIVLLLAAVAFVAIQYKIFRARHYEIVPQQRVTSDPKERYLPQKKKR